MEAARVAALRGHEVALYEKERNSAGSSSGGDSPRSAENFSPS